MNWLLDSSPNDITVGIEDELAIRVIEAIDLPKGSFVLDPYADSRIPAYRVSKLVENIQHAISKLIEQHRHDIMEKLRLPKWPLWAENTLNAEITKDPLLGVLTQLNALGAKAMEFDSDIIVYGD
jgi:hypothetical protein